MPVRRMWSRLTGHMPQPTMHDSLPREVTNRAGENWHDSLPHLHDSLPHLYNSLPHLHDSLPHLHDSLPQLHDPLPHLHDSLPQIFEVYFLARKSWPDSIIGTDIFFRLKKYRAVTFLNRKYIWSADFFFLDLPAPHPKYFWLLCLSASLSLTGLLK